MPLIQIFTSASEPTSDAKAALLNDLSRLLAETFQKPERWSMTCLVPDLSMTFAGQTTPCAFVAIRNVGKMTPAQTEKMSAAICRLLSPALGLPADRLYIEFGDVDAYLWGWNGSTFA
ncbi:MAG TPA: phenylpyruvate tautomerase MIF-related protein [Polyangia bacterium]|jgi:phenylpyruvate tautomerase PptA (4-oxalocrotonate tautomerase family)